MAGRGLAHVQPAANDLKTLRRYAPPVLTTLCVSNAREQGYGACSLFKQRAQRWCVTRLRRLGWTALLLWEYRGGSLWRNVWFRIRYFHVITDLLVFLLQPIFIARAFHDSMTVGVARCVLIRLKRCLTCKFSR